MATSNSLFVTVIAVYAVSSVNSVGHCPDGRAPMPNANCGLSPTAIRCPHGYYCNSSPVDAYAECCPTHCGDSPPLLSPSGKPVYCGLGGVSCPDTYSCRAAPNDGWAVCCIY